MNEIFVNVLGFCAGALTTASFFPQVVQTWRTRSTRDLNLTMFVLLTVGILLWLIYGILITAWPIIIANAVGIVNAGIILTLKLKHG